MRLKDLILLILAVGSLFTGVGRYFVLAKTVEDTEADVKEIKVRVDNNDKRLSVNDERWNKIQKDVEQIKRLIRRNGSRDR